MANLQNYLNDQLEDIRKQRLYADNLNNMPKVEVHGFSDFFFNASTTIDFRFSKQEMKLNHQKLYLSLFEENINFNKPPEEKNIVGNQLILSTRFKFSQKVQPTTFLSFYNDESKIKTLEFAYLEKPIRVDVPKEAHSYRVAIRLEGVGTFQIDEMKIEQDNKLTSHTVDNSSDHKPKKGTLRDFKLAVEELKYNRQVKSKDLKVASILDEFSHECFRYDCDLKAISKENWKEELLNFKPDFLLVESCWRGNQGEWTYEIANIHVNKHRTALKELTDFCKDQGILTLFWDKEGVENFDFFKQASSYFDHIFTADENNIENYKAYTNNDNVHVLAFAAQPQIHNPIYKNKNELGKIAFAGSYYNNKHELRKKDINNIIKPSLKYGTHIFDRYHGMDPKDVPNNQWPEEYRKSIVGNLNYNQMVEAYKNFDIFLNVNSVQDSKYMFARRVFELLSSRTMVMSGPSLGVEEMFGSLVPVSDSQQSTERLLRMYTQNDILREKIEKEGFRFVQENHTYKNRLQEICDAVGIEKNLLSEPKVSIISATQREEFLDNLYVNIQSQTYKNFEVVIVLNKDDMNIQKWKKHFKDLQQDVKVLQVDESVSLGNCLNEAIDHSSGEVIAKFDDDDYYAPNYLLDMLHSMEYSNADVVGKSAHYVYLESQKMLIVKTMGGGEESYSDFVSGATLVFTRRLIDHLGGFADRSRGEDSDLLKRAKEEGYLTYSNDKFNFCLFRRANTSSHTWHVDEAELLRNAASHSYTSDYKTPITL
ncbi:glycosyltransferase [Halobacillus litoralis]|uniref:glycosyltransferase family protein n=1 Tax=Halobacillus litoralis TaxID=45668 RepID=UPI001CFCE86A|nr:glycosyltransferase [Halobacillus litoralis]